MRKREAHENSGYDLSLVRFEEEREEMAETSRQVTEALQKNVESMTAYFEAVRVQDLTVSIVCFIFSLCR